MRIAFIFLVALAACHTEQHMGLLDDPPTRPRTYIVGTDIDPNDMNELFDAAIAHRETKWKWISGATFVPLDAYGTPAAGASVGFFGTAGQLAGFCMTIDEPVGARLVRIGANVRHVAAEPNGGVLTYMALARYPILNNSLAANGLVTIAANPAASNPAHTLEVLGNNAAGAKWEEIRVTLNDTDHVDIEDGYVYVIYGVVSGAQVVGAVGYSIAIDG